MPLLPARRNMKPRAQGRMEKKRHQRALYEMVRRIAMRKPKRILTAPSTRPKIMRGVFPLTVDQRIKFGWEWLRRVSVMIVSGMMKANGWVVCWRAWSCGKLELAAWFTQVKDDYWMGNARNVHMQSGSCEIS